MSRRASRGSPRQATPDLFRALILRPLREDGLRSLLSLAAVALGVAVVIAIRAANRSAIASFQTTTSALAGGADLLVGGPQPLPVSILPRLFPLNAEAEFIPYLDRHAYDPVHRDSIELLALDELAARAPDASAAPAPAAAANGVLLASAYARLHGLHPGDALALVLDGRVYRFPIAGLLPASAATPPDLAVADLAPALAALEPGSSMPTVDGLRVRLAPGASASELAPRIAALIPAADHVAPPAARQQQDENMLAAFRANLTALAYVSLLVGVFLIYNTVSISVVRRRAAIATVRALGASRGRVMRLFIGEGAVLAVAGGVIGLLLGWLLAREAVQVMQRTIQNLYAPVAGGSVSLRASDAVWALALALATGIAAAWSPARQAARQPPAQALRPGSEESFVRLHLGAAVAGAAVLGGLAWLFARLPEPSGLPLWGFACALAATLALAALAAPLLAALLPRLRRWLLGAGQTAPALAAGSLAGALRRSAVLTAAVAMAIGVMLGVAVMVGSFRQTVNVWLGQQLRADVFVHATDWDRDRPVPLAPALLALAAATPGVAAIEASHSQSWEYQHQPISMNIRWSLSGVSHTPEWNYLFGNAGPLTVSEPLARRFHLRVGEPVTLQAPHGPLTLPLSGIFYDYATDRGLIELDAADFTRAFGPPQATEIGLEAAPGVAPAELRRRLELRLTRANAAVGVVVNDNASLRAEAMRVFDQTFRITYALELITLLVAILGVGNTLLAVVLERGREFAILRFLGASRGQIRQILLAEAALVATLALGLGCAMAAALALILVRVINVQSFGWTIQLHLPWAWLVPAAALVWLATLAAGWLPAGAAQRLDPLQAVNAE